MKNRRFTLLIITNIITLIGFFTLFYNGSYWTKIRQFITYRNDTTTYLRKSQFMEQMDYCTTLYQGQSNIVMFGNSLVYRMFWNELLERQDVANRGAGTDITQGLIVRLPFVYKAKPKICFIEGGINDIMNQINPDSTLKHLAAIVDKLKERNIIPVLHTVIYVSSDEPNHKVYNSKVSALNERILQFAKAANVKVINLNPHLSQNQQLKHEYAQGDGIHLTSKAYLIWKEEIRKVLDEYHI
ncbi:GDSL-type esterase/lipase family protein [Ferruginibacter sp. SUN002]|uniref:GDSL-type esterase/lipase family protein n=1 Tax=Ferruginibacter sp. SUN002 TaxID=2937789 RepID=UPI003D36FBCB